MVKKRGLLGKEIKKEEVKIEDELKQISLKKIIIYNLLFFIPVFVSVYLSILLSKQLHNFLQLTSKTAFSLILIPFITLIFFFIIPYIRKREKKAGFRMVVVGFLIVGIFMAVPSMLKGDSSMVLNQMMYLAIFLLLTFIYSPEVLGVTTDIKEWFKHHHQVLIVSLYVVIMLLFISSFASLYQRIYNDQTVSKQFNMLIENPGYGTFFYYSTITFATVGYGDITPVGTAARIVASTEAIFSMVLNTLFIAILLLFISNLSVFGKRK